MNNKKTHLYYILGIILGIFEIMSFAFGIFVLINLILVLPNILFKTILGVSVVFITVVAITLFRDFINVIKQYIKWLRN